MGPVSTIASVLRECANSCPDTNSRKALSSEVLALQFFLKQKHKLLFHRKKLFGIEVDLVLHDEDGIIQFVEVKTYTDANLIPFRVTSKQKNRLMTAKTFFENRFGLPTQIILAAVKNAEVVTYIIG
jgi:Holliday junction resolvase-like predicted endonuclease